MVWEVVMNKMLFRDYVELLFKAYLEDRNLLEKLRGRITTANFAINADEQIPSSDWKQHLPLEARSSDSLKSHYFPNKLDPQEGIRVYEDMRVGNSASVKFKKLAKERIFRK
jgi:hypothetical protein